MRFPKHPLIALTLAGLLAAVPGSVFAQQAPPMEGNTQELIAVLQDPGAELFDKAKACQALAVVGTKEAVPVLAGLLSDPKLSHYARFGLEPIPDPSVDEALRAALGNLRGGLLVGVIDSIGMRRDAKAVGDLERLLSGSDTAVAGAAAFALGRIATPEAVAALRGALAGPASLRSAAADACLTAGDALIAQGKKADAVALYDALREADLPTHIDIAALHGAILARGSDGVPLLVECLRSDDKARMKVALRMAHELPADAVAGALVEELARLEPAPEKKPKIVGIVKAEYGAAGTWLDVTDKVRAAVRNNSLSIEAGNSLAGDPVQGVVKQLRVTYTLDGQQHTVEVPEGETLQLQGDFTPHPRQVLLISVLGDIGAKGAAPAVLEIAKAGPLDMRLAAIRALATLGDASAVPALLDAAEAEGELGEAARESLAALPGKEVDAALAEMLGRSKGPKLLALIDLVGRRSIASAAPALVKLADSDDEQVRVAAIAALGPTAGPSELPALLDRLVKAEPAEVAVAVKAALTKACQRMPDRDACAAVLIERMDNAPGPIKSELLDLLGVVGGAKALDGVTAAAKSDIPPLQDAATRVLGTWMSPDAAPVLLDLAKTMKLAQFRVRALRGYLRIARQLDVPIDGRIAMCRKALDAAMRNEEKQLALEVLGRYPTADGLALVVPYLEDEALKQPAAEAAVAIAEKIAGEQPAAVAAAMDKVLQSTPNDETAAKARRLKNRARRKGGQ